MYEFWYDYVKPKYGEKAKLCYMDTGSLIAYIKADDIYKDTTEDVEINWINERLLGGKIMTKFVGLRAKTFSYLDDDSEDKKAKGTKNCVIKRKLTFKNSKLKNST